MDTITYKGREYRLTFSWGAQYLFEAMQAGAGEARPFDPSRLWDVHRMLFATLRAANHEAWEEDFDAFLAELEAHPTQAVSWTRALVSEIGRWGEALRSGVETAGKKKAAAR